MAKTNVSSKVAEAIAAKKAKIKAESVKPAEEYMEAESAFETVTSNKIEGDVIMYSDLFGTPDGNFKGKDFPVSVFSEEYWDEEVAHMIPDEFEHVIDHSVVFPTMMGIETGQPTLLHGAPGTGKTTVIKLIAHKTKRPYIRVNGQAGVEPADYIGSPVITNGTMSYSLGRVGLAVKHGALLAIDEPFKLDAGVMMAFQWMFEKDNPSLLLYGHPDTSQQMLPAHPDFRVVLADNVRGVGDGFAQFAATTVQDSSTLNRMGVRVNVGYLNMESEMDLVRNHLGRIGVKLPDTAIRKMVMLANAIRSGWSNGQFEIPYSPRDLISWVDFASKCNDIGMGFLYTYAEGCSEQEQQVLRKLWSDAGFTEKSYL